jgi:chromosome partitioning protein
MILTVGNTKGGVGKTTLAVNIAIARSLLGGSDVLLIGVALRKLSPAAR